MITKYTRKDINKNPHLHSEEFVLRRDCEWMLLKFIEDALAAGANANELMKGIDDET